MMNLIYLMIAGFLSGIIGGMGMGGGTLLIPILTIFLNFQQKNAQAINLLAFIPMSLGSLIIHMKNKLVDFKVGIPIIITGIVFSILGSCLASILNNQLLQKIYAIFLLIVGVYQAIQTIFCVIKKKSVDKEKRNYKLKIFIK